MNNIKRQFIMDELMIENFIEYSANVIHLEETEDTGKSELNFQVVSNKNLIIKNVDKKHTELHFFQKNKMKSMFKRVDHIIFENVSDNNWNLHLIEMKSSVGTEKWIEVKGKFRASYLLAQGIAAMLEMHIIETYMYTTYEKVRLSLAETMPSARRLRLGEKAVSAENEWNGSNFGLNFGTTINFIHKPIQMQRNEQDILIGEYVCGNI